MIVILTPLMPLYNLERSPPYEGAKGTYSAFAMGEAKLEFTTAAMLTMLRDGGDLIREAVKCQNCKQWTFSFSCTENAANEQGSKGWMMILS